jgi:hypothetical protein
MTAFFGVTTSVFLATEEAKAMAQTNFILLILTSICAFAESVSAVCRPNQDRISRFSSSNCTRVQIFESTVLFCLR